MEWNIGSLNDFTAQAKLHYAKICPPETTITIAKVLQDKLVVFLII